jgi:hypothetical protein
MQSINFENPEAPGERGYMPFSVMETHNSLLSGRTRISDSELYKLLSKVRAEMEVSAHFATRSS